MKMLSKEANKWWTW